MQVIRRFSENKTHTYRWLFILQIISPIIMYIGARNQVPLLIVMGLILIILANGIAVLTK